MIKVAVTGAAGRMGSGIIRKITEQDDMEVVAAIEMPNTPLAGVDAGEKAGIGNIGVPIVGSEDLEKALKESGAEVLVDFTIAPAAVETIKTATACGVNVVVGTTGFTEEQMASNIKNVEDNNVGAVISSNMAIGVNVFFNTLKKLAPLLYDFDIEIIEKHHNQKIDAPSGTALALADAISEVMDSAPEYVYDRHSVRKKRTKNEIGIHAVRGGTITGEHQVIFAGHDEIITVSHSARSKELFATGAVNAAGFICGKKAGLYNMSDMLR
mgnify:CR=1 FL=1